MWKRIVFIFSCGLLSCFAHANSDANRQDKIYIELENLVFDSTGIWFKTPVNAVVVGTSALHIDAGGYYVAEGEQTWKCPHCGTVNANPYPGIWGCRKCGFPFFDSTLGGPLSLNGQE